MMLDLNGLAWAGRLRAHAHLGGNCSDVGSVKLLNASRSHNIVATKHLMANAYTPSCAGFQI